jgi:hypothetical protein
VTAWKGIFMPSSLETDQACSSRVIRGEAFSLGLGRIGCSLLCPSAGECEQRLSKNGENWFLAHCSRKGQFRLAALLDASTPADTYPNLTVYRAAQIPKIDISAFTYFAASTFWRAAVLQWSLKGSGTKSIELGLYLGLYKDQLRTYLMGESLFPQDYACGFPSRPH